MDACCRSSALGYPVSPLRCAPLLLVYLPMLQGGLTMLTLFFVYRVWLHRASPGFARWLLIVHATTLIGFAGCSFYWDLVVV